MKTVFLDFEQPIAELEGKIEELRYVHEDSAVDISEEIQRLSEEEPGADQGDLRQAHPLAGGAGRAPSAASLHARLHRACCSPISRSCTATAPSPTTPAIVGGLARFNGAAVHGDRPPEGPRHQGEDPAQLRHAAPRGLPQGAAPDAAGREVRLPIFTFIDTPGAYPGVGAEERGQSEAIGRNLYVMAELKVRRSSAPSSARAAPAARWPSRWATRC